MSNIKNNFKIHKPSSLLIITPGYPDKDNSLIMSKFVKEQVEYLKSYFDTVYIISPIPHSFGLFESDKLCHDYTYDNIKIYFPRCYYVPIFYFKKILLDNRLKVIINTIEKNNLKFDVIHAHTTWPSGYIGAKLKEKYHVPSILTIHENGDWFEKEVKMDFPLINYAWENSDVLIRVNNKDIPILKQYNDNTYSIPNGYSSKYKILNKKECRDILNIQQDKKVIFSLGVLIKRKGFNFLIDAIKIILKSNPDILCVIGGSGPLKKKLEKQIHDLKLNNHVLLAGFIQEEQLPIWINACDIFVLPSLSESFGIVQIEAMACGKPVIATYNGGSEEIIISDEYGLLVDPRNAYDLAQKIEIALNKQWDKEKILKYAEQYQWENIASRIVSVYNKTYSENVIFN
ncbi:glycosyltransferase [Methanosarcina mazei]|uniref:Glycosyl transferase family 1 n=2 Tax=Methanosarcina mazei TaxID=2209 RepID=A0A0F8HW47_METMZ|nr:glycosyltransferase [Methanosarcina mazei]AKB70026.1 Glycosyl transferase, group 1 [Methanosarcina mazei C16]KKG71274.1 glycosyl transferase family 1 [Methanosarcina mazei]KKG84696.1 glycosyl transferase family 1 [Methanosarcina mazei]KKH09214.1 glycosyl transferase family 1 [Methanosarcina mazei]KKH09881.1 glycosyl transferase family 1 [Methanosarcina mazei]